jgi:hypothetical protein
MPESRLLVGRRGLETSTRLRIETAIARQPPQQDLTGRKQPLSLISAPDVSARLLDAPPTQPVVAQGISPLSLYSVVSLVEAGGVVLLGPPSGALRGVSSAPGARRNGLRIGIVNGWARQGVRYRARGFRGSMSGSGGQRPRVLRHDLICGLERQLGRCPASLWRVLVMKQDI